MRKIILSLIVWFVWLISFWYCQIWITWYDTSKVLTKSVKSSSLKSSQTVWNYKVLNNDWDLSHYAFSYIHDVDNAWWNYLDSSYDWITCLLFDRQYPWITYYVDNVEVNEDFNNWKFVCTDSTNVKFYSDISQNYYKLFLSKEYFMDFFQPQYTSQECQFEYSLMPISSCNSEYCEMNNLCSVIWWSWSSTLYINDVWHESAPFIYVNIPDEIKRDYLTWEQEFTINVEWLNGDQDYINWIIDVNSYRPSSEDFTQTFVWWLTLIFPYIIITAVILFIRRFIRKIFK